MRRRVLDAVVAAVAGGFAVGLGACSEAADPPPVRDPAAAASAAIDERASRPRGPGSDAADSDSPAVRAADAAGGLADGSRGEAGSAATAAGEVIAHYNLDLEDCFDRVESLVSGRERATTTRVPCSRPHMFQVFGRLDYPGDPAAAYPGDAAMEDFALRSCYRLFEQWTGSVYETSALEIEALTPNLRDFTDALYPYRGIHCLVHRDDGAPLTGTARSSGL